MSTRDIHILKEGMAIRATEFEKMVKADLGISIIIYCTRRDAAEQARVYRRSRTKTEIAAKAEWYKVKGFPGLANILLDVGPQFGDIGKHFTYAGPGESWHQYDLAWDMVPIVNGKLLWRYDRNKDIWDKLTGLVVSEFGLYTGARFGDYPHVSKYTGNPLDHMSKESIANVVKFGAEKIA